MTTTQDNDGQKVNIIYTIKPKPDKVLAKFDGINARCGKCNQKLGEFLKAEGEVKCSGKSMKNSKWIQCGIINIIKI